MASLQSRINHHPVYVSSLVVYGAAAPWAGPAQSYCSEFSARVIIGTTHDSVELFGRDRIVDGVEDYIVDEVGKAY